MPRIIGQPSPDLKEKGSDLKMRAFFIALGGISMIYVLLNSYIKYPSYLNLIVLAVISLVLIIQALIYYRDDSKSSKNYHQGSKGEKEIFKELLKLGDEYTVFCDVVIKPPYNIDFVVLGPAGVFAIEAKSHSGFVDVENKQVTIDKKVPREKDFLSQTRAEAASLKNYLKDATNYDFWIDSVLAFSSPAAKMRFGLKPVDNVHIVQKTFLLPLLKQPKQNALPDYMLTAAEGALHRLKT